MREDVPSQFPTTDHLSGLRSGAKSLFRNILAINHFDSRFCQYPRQRRFAKSLKINILTKATGKSPADRCPNSAANSLFRNILHASPCESRFYTGQRPSQPHKSLRMNILRKYPQKIWEANDEFVAQVVGTLLLRGSFAAHPPAALRVTGFGNGLKASSCLARSAAQNGPPRTMVSGGFPDAHFDRPWFVYHDRAMAAFRVVAKAAPWPLLGFEHQATLDWVAMHVAQLLHALLFREYHKVIEAVLPNVLLCRNRDPRGFGLLRIRGGEQPAQDAACESLFDGLHD
jgi:hypothetical protein